MGPGWAEKLMAEMVRFICGVPGRSGDVGRAAKWYRGEFCRLLGFPGLSFLRLSSRLKLASADPFRRTQRALWGRGTGPNALEPDRAVIDGE